MRPPDPSIPFPAVHKEGHTRWRSERRAGEAVGWGVTALVLLAVTAFFLLDTEKFSIALFTTSIAFPLWIVSAFFALVFLGFLWVTLTPPAPWYQQWSFVEAIEEGEGLRLFAGRLGKDHPGVLVRPGETIELAVTPGGAPDDNQLRVWVSGQVLEVQVDCYLPALTYAPLAAAAAERGISVVRARTAEAIPVP